MKRLLCLLALCASHAMAGGYLSNPAQLPDYPSSVVIAGQQQVGVGVSGCGDDNRLLLDTWHIPVFHYYLPRPGDMLEIDIYDGWISARLSEGNYRAEVLGTTAKGKFVCGYWFDQALDDDPFSLPQVTQRWNTGPYGYGKSTIEQKGCLLCSILSWGMRYDPEITWTINDYNTVMVKNHGFFGESVISSVAANLLDMVYVGEFSYSKENLEKYSARGWGMVLKNRVPHFDNKGKLYYTTHWTALKPGVWLKPGDWNLGIMDPYLRRRWVKPQWYIPYRIKVFAPKSFSGSLWAIPYSWGKSGWWKKSALFAKVSSMEFNSSSDICITRVTTPDYVLREDSSEEYATLSDTTEGASSATLLDCVKGTYAVQLFGRPCASYEVSMAMVFDDGRMRVLSFRGLLGNDGKATVSFWSGR